MNAMHHREIEQHLRDAAEIAAERAGERARDYADGASGAVRGLARHGRRIRDRFSDRRNDYRRELTRVAGELADEANYRYRRARRQVKQHPVATLAIVAGTVGAFLLLRRAFRSDDE
jgi:hypothetical protein